MRKLCTNVVLPVSDDLFFVSRQMASVEAEAKDSGAPACQCTMGQLLATTVNGQRLTVTDVCCMPECGKLVGFHPQDAKTTSGSIHVDHMFDKAAVAAKAMANESAKKAIQQEIKKKETQVVAAIEAFVDATFGQSAVAANAPIPSTDDIFGFAVLAATSVTSTELSEALAGSIKMLASLVITCFGAMKTFMAAEVTRNDLDSIIRPTPPSAEQLCNDGAAQAFYVKFIKTIMVR